MAEKKTQPKADESQDQKNKKPKTKNQKEEGKINSKKKESVKKEKNNKLKKSEKKHFKKYREVETLIEKGKTYSLEESLSLIKKTSVTKFDSSVEIHISLGIDMKKADQQIRGSVVLPHGTGKNKKICAIVGADKEKEAKEAGADFCGGIELIEKINKGWFDFDVLVATPDMMANLGKVAKILGPKGLMPNPKAGTVSQDIAKTIKSIKTGMVEYRADAYGIVHQMIGKVSFDEKKLTENYETLLDIIRKSKPASSKGVYIKSIYLTTTMGPSVKVAL